MTSSASSCSMTAGSDEKSLSSPTNASEPPAPRPTSEPTTPMIMGPSPAIIATSETQAPNACLGKRKPTRPPSDAWKHFVKVGDKAKCKYCGTMYACDTKKNGTSNLNKHILSQCRKYNIRGLKQKTLSFEPETDGGEGGKVNSATCSEEAFREAIAKMIIIDGLPFKHVEGEAFRNFCKLLEPRFEVPSPITVARDCLQIYLKEKQKLKDFFASSHQRVCLTTYTWTSIQNLNYTCLTAHYVDSDWRLQKKILSFCQIVNHEGDTTAKAVETCLSQWGIEKLFTVTVDGTSSNEFTFALSKIMNNWNGTLMRVDFMHMRCFAHVFNLIVVEGLKDYNDSISRIRNVVTYVTSSPSRLQKFKVCAEREKISSNKLVLSDVTTKWNSTYLMLEAAEKFQKAFELLGVVDVEYLNEFCLSENNAAPSSADWGHARAFIKLSRVFCDATLPFSGSLFVTSNSFLHQLCLICSELRSWSESGDAFLRVMAENMRKEFDKYWGHCQTINHYLFVAVLLDPRYKEPHLKYCFEMLCGESVAVQLTNKVRITLNELYDEYKLLYFESMEIPKNSGYANEVEVKSEVDVDMLVTSSYMTLLKESDSVTEVDQYLMESCENLDESSFDILDWWKTNSSKYKILSNIARDVLAIPVSTVASGSAFSTCGRILDPFRSSLPPRTVEALVCAQNWLRSSMENDLHGITDEVEEIELDTLGAAPELTFDDN